MRGILFTSKGVTEVVEEPKPTCGEDQVLLRTLFSGLSNGTERSFLMGGPYGSQTWPSRIGYLNVSQVVEKGGAVTRFELGDTVYTGTFPGHVEYHIATESSLIAKLPPGLAPQAATMLGIAGVAYFNAEQAGVSADDNLLVTGAGPIGLMAVQAAKAKGARVTLASRTQQRRELGATLGADAAFDPDTEADVLREHGPYSVLLECAGVELDPLMTRPTAVLAPFARVALIAGRFRVDYDFVPASLLRLSFRQSTHFDQPALDAVVALAADGTLNPGALVQEVVPITEAVDIYDRLRDAPMSLGGTVFAWV
jgi:2-desacetyl-2-hydroxyethyl bacteriochlorophyllide A dehydrogenase